MYIFFPVAVTVLGLVLYPTHVKLDNHQMLKMSQLKLMQAALMSILNEGFSLLQMAKMKNIWEAQFASEIITYFICTVIVALCYIV